jgi:RNA polymerase sigma-70 factor (ECF subfamily)
MKMVSFLLFFCHVFVSRAFIMMMIGGTAADTGGEVDISVRDNSTDLNGRQLIANARVNPVVFAKLYRRHYDSVFRYCLHRLFDRQAAEDVTSAVFMKAVENLGGFSGSEKQFRNWLYKIATNAVNNHLRQAACRSRALRAVGEGGKSRRVDCGVGPDDNAEKVTILKEAMLTLKPRYQTIIAQRER